MAAETVQVKQYPAEMAGERVGWVSTMEMSEDQDVIGVNIVAATVGEQGARLTYPQYEDGERLSSGDDARGFVAIAGLFMMISKEGGVERRGGTYFRGAGHRPIEASAVLRKGGSGYDDFVPKEEDLEWADNPAELLDRLKSKLAERELGQHYPDVYYTFNGMMGHETYRRLFDVSSKTPAASEWLVPDKSMHAATHSQVEVAERVVQQFASLVHEDVRMKQRLTVFSDIPAAEVPEAFVVSRRAVAATEKEIIEVKKQLYAPDLSYLPIGFRPSGRSWPYMDAAESNEEKAFGIELGELRAQQVGSVSSELSKETRELEQRLEHARFGRNVLQLLWNAEQAL